MNTIQTRARTSPDGTLNLTLSLGQDGADREVVVTVAPSPRGPSSPGGTERSQALRALAGSIDDPTFHRHEQGPLEERDELP